jgi:hypothetical protein
MSWLRRLVARIWPRRGKHHADPFISEWPDPADDWPKMLPPADPFTWVLPEAERLPDPWWVLTDNGIIHLHIPQIGGHSL